MSIESIKNLFNEHKILSLSEVAEKYDYSIRTIQRKFAALSVLKSYNKNSRYFTLPEIPEFNQHGIWFHEDIYFSKHGDLRSTVQNLICTSESGLNGNEIGEIVNLLPRSFMHHFRNIEGIFRDKYDGVFIYFSNDPEVYKNQSINRNQSISMKEISDANAVKLLVEYIKNPDLSSEELSITLMNRTKTNLSPSMILDFFSFYGIVKKNVL
ncbi:MAG: hypothetical protein GY804_05225 [Alphaproteobacteria bacterium]|nr:hypothetical protein [Alphaproteobacteria bacterium]